MRREGLYQWKPLTEDGDLQWLKYSFGPGTANSLAAKLPDHTWLVISPPCEAPPAVYDRLDQMGGVSALVAPNPYHNKGQAAWRQRFPGSQSYAPSGALPRLSSKTPAIDYESMEDLARRISPLRAWLPEGMKAPDVLFQIPVNAGYVWWMGDSFSNSSRSDQVWPLRLVARFAGSGLGYRVNSKPELVYVRDRAAWIASIRKELSAMPPWMVIPAHGDPVTEQVVERTRHAIDAVDTRRRSGESESM